MKKVVFFIIAATILISYQAAAQASCGQTGAKGNCKMNFSPGNKHAVANAK